MAHLEHIVELKINYCDVSCASAGVGFGLIVRKFVRAGEHYVYSKDLALI